MIQHHRVRLAPDAALLIPAKRRVRRIRVIAVRPNPPCLYPAPKPVAPVRIAAPDARAQPIQRVIGNRQRLVLILEGAYRNHRPKDLLLEDPHLVMPLKDRRLHIVPALKIAIEHIPLAAGQDFGPLLPADIHVAQNLLQLLTRSLRPNHRRRVQRIPLLHSRHAFQRPLHKPVIHRLLNQRPARTRTNLALIQRKHRKALKRLVKEVIILLQAIRKEDIRRLTA